MRIFWRSQVELRFGALATCPALGLNGLMDGPNPHGGILTIDLGAIAQNWRLLKERAAPAECSAVIKADAYGLGIEPVSQALAKAGCHTFFVAHLSEALRVRRSAPLAHVYVLNGLPPGSEPMFVQNRVRPVLGTLGELKRWREAGGGPAALHVDTGMNRLGLNMGDAQALSVAPDWQHAQFDFVMSHMVASEEPGNPLNIAQSRHFERMAALFGVRAKKRSLANSSAHFLPEPPRYDLTRPGYALYGGNPTPGQENPMHPVVKLEATIIQIRSIEPGETVGYNAQWTAKAPSRIATVSLGYADGWLRSLSATDAKPGGTAMVHGVRCPFAGRVSMDLITIDVTGAPEGQPRVGQTVTLIGDGIGVDDVAEMAGTNGYEILTSLGARYNRRYVNQ
jgi:alanine racemase